MQTRLTILLIAMLNLLLASSVFADHERSRIHRHYDQLRREIHEQRRWQFEQLHDFHRARREALEKSWKYQRRNLRGRTRVHFDRQYHDQRREMERDFDRKVRSLNEWREHEIDRLQQAERNSIRAYEAGYRTGPYPIKYPLPADGTLPAYGPGTIPGALRLQQQPHSIVPGVKEQHLYPHTPQLHIEIKGRRVQIPLPGGAVPLQSEPTIPLVPPQQSSDDFAPEPEVLPSPQSPPTSRQREF